MRRGDQHFDGVQIDSREQASLSAAPADGCGGRATKIIMWFSGAAARVCHGASYLCR